MGKKRQPSDSSQLFSEQFVPAEAGSGKLFDVEYTGKDQPVTCLGMTFENDESRRKYFSDQLREKFKDPEFREIEGFPIGEDDDILNLSDPPYYTACPNPWIADFIAEWESQKPPKPEGWTYHREPFAADVSEGKNDPIYNAHSYHTKVPHKAIMRYILHYTEPGDIVLDGFCGTGMTGVAAQMCGDREVVMSLGYQVKPDGTILQEETDEDGNKTWRPFAKLGARKVILNDLSPAATFIAYNYNIPLDVAKFEKECSAIFDEVEKECKWMYETLHTDGKTLGKINYTVFSDVFICAECSEEVVFWDAAVDHVNARILDSFSCPKCDCILTKRAMERAWVNFYDPALKQSFKRAKRVPVLINYAISTEQHSLDKKPGQQDFELLETIDNLELKHWFPTVRMMDGQETRRNDPIGITHTHHFYTTRNLFVLSTIWNSLPQGNPLWKSIFTSVTQGLSMQQRFRPQTTFPNMVMSGTLYVGSLIREWNALNWFFGKISGLRRGRFGFRGCMKHFVAMCSSFSTTNAPSDSIDYLFVDPPFGSNLNYSELNFNWEAWLKVRTNIFEEAIENKTQNKGLSEYRILMTSCFSEAYRVLKPGRWMTVEFSNTNASVWNSIQTALTEAGFVVANVSCLDKQQKSFKAITSPTAVKQDLVISAYKPNGGFEERFQKQGQTEEGVWDFIRTHLNYLPVTKQQGVVLQFVPERDPRILFDQMVAYYVRKGFPVPMSSQEFQIGLAQRFIERDGMYFLPEQVAEYDRKKALTGQVQQASLFVSDESSAIQWLRQLIREKPQTFADINPQFMQQLGGWSKNEAQLDLRELLEQNFLSYDGKGPVPEQIHAYLSSNWKEMRNLAKDDPQLIAKAKGRWYVPDSNKAGDLEKLREKALLKEFDDYKAAKKKLKVFRLEAVRAGFKRAWQDRDYPAIVAIADKIPNNVLEEDPKLLMWYDQAVTRLGE